MAARLRRNNPRLSAARAAFLAEHWAEPDGHGRFRVAGDPAHRIVNPVLYRFDEALACWSPVTSPALMVLAAESDAMRLVARDRDRRGRKTPRRFAAVPGAALRDGAGRRPHAAP